jgi:hypothetical protein
MRGDPVRSTPASVASGATAVPPWPRMSVVRLDRTGHGRGTVHSRGKKALRLVAAIVIAVLFVVFAWLVSYAIARVIFLVLTVLGALGALSRMGGAPASAVAGSLVSVLFDAGFAFVLLMSFLAPQQSRS